jgi:hypothetical protein
MMMESEHMVVGDDVSDDGGREDLKIPLSGVESRTNLTPPETKIVDVAAFCFAKGSVLLDT